MPYKSLAQAGKFHEMLKRGEISKSVVDEFDKASKGLSLPKRIGVAPHPAQSIHPNRRATPRVKNY